MSLTVLKTYRIRIIFAYITIYYETIEKIHYIYVK